MSDEEFWAKAYLVAFERLMYSYITQPGSVVAGWARDRADASLAEFKRFREAREAVGGYRTPPVAA